VSVEVDATRIGWAPQDRDNHRSFWGVTCRKSSSNINKLPVNSYFLGISSDGSPVIVKSTYEHPWSYLASGDPSDDISTEKGATNRIRGDCVGGELTLYVNDQKPLEAEDAEFDSGMVGLSVSNEQPRDESPAADILFDNFSASRP
jgi:hypothetical protein